MEPIASYKCPECQRGIKWERHSAQYSTGGPCNVCKGSGVVWLTADEVREIESEDGSGAPWDSVRIYRIPRTPAPV